ncbi:MAG: protein-L-isoaspartate(D-aspartate) O-methyltransferase [Solirubrobacteraceae bacterium]
MNEAAALARRLRAAVGDERVLAAIASIPRERFVAERERSRAYENVALPIACEQTISQPVVVARMLEALHLCSSDCVLDIGTGSGYHAALLALLGGKVWTIERHAQLQAQAERTIDELELDNVTFVLGDGCDGLPAQAPFDAINVAAATREEVARVLERQLAVGGRMVAPVGVAEQYLTVTWRTAQGFERAKLEPVRFVPLIAGATD